MRIILVCQSIIAIWFCNFNFSCFAQENNLSPSNYFIIDSIILVGNNITKPKIILRELEFNEGDTVNVKDFDKLSKLSQENLINTSLFNFVNLDMSTKDSVHIILSISVIERWYTWPIPLLELATPNFNTWWVDQDLNKINYGFYIIKENFRGRKESLKFRFRFGYDQQIAMQYNIPFINKMQSAGLEFTAGYSYNHEIHYGTVANKMIFYKSDDSFARKEFFIRTSGIFRKKLYNKQSVNLQYTSSTVLDTIIKLAPDYFNKDNNKIAYISCSWAFIRDKRDYIYYPLSGSMFYLKMTKEGFALIDKTGIDLLYAYSEFHQHFKIEDRLYFAYGINGKLNFLDKPPYYFQKGLGYVNFVRGYEYYVIDGQSYALLKSNFKFAIIKDKTGEISFIKTDKFRKYHYSIFLNLFADAGYVVDDLYGSVNNMSNALQIGSGVGIDFLTYYDMILRLEFSVNKYGENGLYIHFEKPI